MKKKGLKISLGHKHEWIDTQGHTHFVVFDEKTLEKPKATWAVLAVVTVLAVVAGLFGVLTARHDDARNGAIQTNSTPSYEYKFSVYPEGEEGLKPIAITAGWNDELFVVYRDGAHLYDRNGQHLNYWGDSNEKTPTAVTFVSDENDPRDGSLLIAYGDELRVLRFNQNNVVTDESGAVHYSAHDGAGGDPILLANMPDVDICAIVVATDRLYAADLKTSRVLRYSWSKIDAVAEAEDKTVIPDCVVGDPDPTAGYPGLALAQGRWMSLAYVPLENQLLVANPRVLRVDAFNANTGLPSSDRAFVQTGLTSVEPNAVSPLVIAAFGASGVVASGVDPLAEETTIVTFNSRGDALSKTVADKDRRDEPGDIVAVDASDDGKRIYALCSDGVVDVWESAN